MATLYRGRPQGAAPAGGAQGGAAQHNLPQGGPVQANLQDQDAQWQPDEVARGETKA